MLIIAALLLTQAKVDARAPKQSAAKTFSAVVMHVTDGDTVWVSKGRGTQAISVRIQGIDAPEICQTYGGTSAAALLNLLQHQTVRITGRAHDKYGRVVAKLSVSGQDVGAWLVENGHAWSYHSTRSLGPYRVQETAARQARRGLWASGLAIEPKLFRKQTKCYQ